MKIEFDHGEREELVELMAGWVEAVDAPDEPIFGVAGSAVLISPRDLVREVRAGTEVGERYIRDLAQVVARDAMAKVTSRTFGR